MSKIKLVLIEAEEVDQASIGEILRLVFPSPPAPKTASGLNVYLGSSGFLPPVCEPKQEPTPAVEETPEPTMETGVEVEEELPPARPRSPNCICISPFDCEECDYCLEGFECKCGGAEEPATPPLGSLGIVTKAPPSWGDTTARTFDAVPEPSPFQSAIAPIQEAVRELGERAIEAIKEQHATEAPVMDTSVSTLARHGRAVEVSSEQPTTDLPSSETTIDRAKLCSMYSNAKLAAGKNPDKRNEQVVKTLVHFCRATKRDVPFISELTNKQIMAIVTPIKEALFPSRKKEEAPATSPPHQKPPSPIISNERNRIVQGGAR